MQMRTRKPRSCTTIRPVRWMTCVFIFVMLAPSKMSSSMMHDSHFHPESARRLFAHNVRDEDVEFGIGIMQYTRLTFESVALHLNF